MGLNQDFNASPSGWASNIETVNQERRNPIKANNTKPKETTIRAIPVFLYVVRFIKNNPQKGTDRSPIIRGVGIRKSIILVYLNKSIFQRLIVGFQFLLYI